MLTTQTFTCSLPKAIADALNSESGRIYTATLVEHYRVYRHTGNWLSDFITSETLMHAHSRDAAQEAFLKPAKLRYGVTFPGNLIHLLIQDSRIYLRSLY